MSETTLIKNNILSSSKMEQGTWVSGRLIGFQPGNYNKQNILLMKDDGQLVTIFPSGNLTFLPKDVTRGKYNTGDRITITRTGSKPMTFKDGSTGSAAVFSIVSNAQPAAAQTATSNQAPTVAPSVDNSQAAMEAELAAIKAKYATA